MGAVGVVAWWSRDAPLGCAALAAAAALGGFLLFNFYPASIFMGDSGALPMGFLLGALALGGGPRCKRIRIFRSRSFRCW
jgi:UDP-N-acetylmuramyl pentapeptide phosphotransferase/UDP-N-acetylglucosamine-1-phosphate transferase